MVETAIIIGVLLLIVGVRALIALDKIEKMVDEVEPLLRQILEEVEDE